MYKNERPDAIYWRRVRLLPEIEYIKEENLHFYPGEGPCVDGYFWWKPKMRSKQITQLVKRIPIEVWLQWGRSKHSPPEEKHWPDVFQESLANWEQDEKP